MKSSRAAGRGWSFYTFIGGAARFMFAWDSDPRRMDALSHDLAFACATAAKPVVMRS
jgi:threonine aldolase